jgi:hypothetical protein
MITGWITERHAAPLIPSMTRTFSEKGDVQ